MAKKEGQLLVQRPLFCFGIPFLITTFAVNDFWSC